MNSGWFGVRPQYTHACLAAAVCALHAAACGGNTSAAPPAPDAAAGSGGQAGSAGAGGSGGGLVEPRCNTRDDGAEVLADNLVRVRDPRLDATHLYHPFVESGSSGFVTRIYKLGLAVGAPLEEISTREGAVEGFVLSEQHVWWTRIPTVGVQHPLDPFEMTLFRVGKTGGPAEVMIPGYVQGIASSPQGLVITRMSENLESAGGKFQLLPWSGRVPTDLCEYDAAGYVAANATVVAWAHRNEALEHTIETCPLTGGPRSTLLALGTSMPVALAVDSTHAFLSTFKAIYRVPLAGGELETIAVHPDPASPPLPLVLDGEEIFFPRGGSRILRVPKTGGTPRDAIPPQTDISFFRVGTTHIYWGEGYPNACLKRTLK